MSEDRTSSEHVHRRTALRVGAATAAAAAAAVVATSSSAQAAVGQAVVQGRSNVVGTPSTFLFSSGATPTLQVRNTGAGAAAAFLATNSNGFAGGTAAGSRYGLSAANTGAAARGAAMAASGGQNTGVLANTANAARYAIEATNLSTAEDNGGAVLAGGGVGAGVVAVTANVDVPALVVGGASVTFADALLVGGALAITYTESSTLYGAVSVDRPAVTVAGVVTLGAGGSATVAIDPAVVADADMAGASVVLTPRSGAMPGLFGNVGVSGVVTISGGTASGTVNFLVTLHQPLVGPGTLGAGGGDRNARVLEHARAAAQR